MKILLALSSLPEFVPSPEASPGPQHNGTTYLCPSVHDLLQAWGETSAGIAPSNPVLELTCPSVVDRSLARPGQHILHVWVATAPRHLSVGNWGEFGDSYADHLLNLLAGYAPNLRSAVLGKTTYTPADLESQFGATEADSSHGAMIREQMFNLRPAAGYDNYRSPVHNLLLCGSGAWPGGGVTGVPGHNAAQLVLRKVY